MGGAHDANGAGVDDEHGNVRPLQYRIVRLRGSQVHDDPIEPREKNDKLSDTSNFMILKMLAKEPEKRYQTPPELLRALKKLLKEL